MAAPTASATPPGLPTGRWPVGVLAALEYWLTSYRRTWRGSVVSGFLSPLLYLGAMGFGLGTLVDSGPGRLGGVAYVGFVAPGVLAATAMQTAVGESTYPVMGAIKWNRQYHAMLAAPLGPAAILLGHLAFVLIRVTMSVTAFVVVAAALGAFTSVGVLAAVPVAVACGAAHAAPVMAFAVRQEKDTGFALLYRFGVIPMFLFSGTFFPVEQLPAGLRPVAWVTPLWHATTLCRDLSLGGVTAGAAVAHVGYLCLWAAGGVWLGLRCYRGRLMP
jgi:lipooligosaccharide transport system permease protein